MAAGPKTIASELSHQAWSALGQDREYPAQYKCVIQNLEAATAFSVNLDLALKFAPGMDRLTNGLWNALQELNSDLAVLLREPESLHTASSILVAIRCLLDDLAESAPPDTAEELSRRGLFVGFGAVTYPIEAAE
jgi:hypothetical protein